MDPPDLAQHRHLPEQTAHAYIWKGVLSSLSSYDHKRCSTWVAGTGHNASLIESHCCACVPLLVHEVQVAGPVGKLASIQRLDMEVRALDAILERLPLSSLSFVGL